MHNSPDLEFHHHSPDFYRDYHDMTDQAIRAAAAIYKAYGDAVIHLNARVCKMKKKDATFLAAIKEIEEREEVLAA
jgi:hypothetical protein